MGELSTPKVNLLGLTAAGIEEFVLGMGEKPFRARQLMKWIYRRGSRLRVDDRSRKDFRQRLAAVAEIRAPEVILSQALRTARASGCWRFESGQAIEMVFHPGAGPRHALHLEPGRLTMDCTFWLHGATGLQSQFETRRSWPGLVANRELVLPRRRPRESPNVVFMGHGRAARETIAIVVPPPR